MMAHEYFISICIPAYKRIADLQRLLDSIAKQTYKDFEVIITDDSPDDSVKTLCDSYPNGFRLLYYKNVTPLGTPENWNEGIRKASGKWVKLMHDDDYFSTEESLSLFVIAIERFPNAQLFYSAFVFEDAAKKEKEIIRCNWFDRFFLSLSPYHMLRRNYFGNPSCIIVKKEVPFFYDNRFKYIVDFAYYIELLQHHTKCVYINNLLITVGLNDEQVTNYTYKNIAVQMYESHVLFEKLGAKVLNNIVAFDYYWRMYRNFDVRSPQELEQYYHRAIDEALQKILAIQRLLPRRLLKIGFFSKTFMLISYYQIRLSELF